MRYYSHLAVNKNRSRGQLLIESAIAVGTMLIALTGIFSLTSQALGLTKVVAERYVASHLAGEGVELIKWVVEGNILAGKEWSAGLEDTIPETTDCFYEMDFNDDGPAKRCGAKQFLRFDNDPDSATYGRYWYDWGSETRFTRTIEIGFNDPAGDGSDDEMIIVSTVEWNRRGGVKEAVPVEAHYYNWKRF